MGSPLSTLAGDRVTVFALQRLRATLLLRLHDNRAPTTVASSLYRALRHDLAQYERDDDGNGSITQQDLCEWAQQALALDGSDDDVLEQLQSIVERFAPYFAVRAISNTTTTNNNNNNHSGGASDVNYLALLEFLFFPIQLTPLKLHLEENLGRHRAYHLHTGWISADAKAQNAARVLIYELSLPKQDAVATNNPAAPAVGMRLHEMVAAQRFVINELVLLSHPNLLRYCGTIQTRSSLFVAHEFYASSCTLKTLLEAFGPMKESVIRRYVLQLCQALNYLHSHDVAHRNLSCESIYIDSYGMLKLGEFGLSYELQQATGFASSNELDWLVKHPPPEIKPADTKRSCWSRKSDVWSVGILVIQMMCGYGKTNIANGVNSSTKANSKIPQRARQSLTLGAATTVPTAVELPVVPSTTSKHLRTVIRSCLQTEPRKRCTIDALLQLPFFQVDPAQDTNELLRSVCTDLDASMKRFMSSTTTSSTPSYMNPTGSIGHPRATRAVSSPYVGNGRPSSSSSQVGKGRVSVAYNY